MNIKQIENKLIESGIASGEAKAEAKMFVKHFLGLSDKDLILNGEFEENEALLQAVNLRVATKKPIQHIIGTAHFMGEDFIVNEHVLIPREETEFLVRAAVEIINKKLPPTPALPPQGGRELALLPSRPLVLDIGTGSGCIACMIAKHSGAQVIGVDISTEALQVALDNATKLNLFNQAIFRKSDIFSNVQQGKWEEKFDLIVSNPPYIPISEKGKLQKEVEFDPELALFAPDDKGIEFYKKIIEQSPVYLNEGGYLAFELGIGQSDLVKELMQNNGFSQIEIIQDLAGIGRVIFGRIG